MTKHEAEKLWEHIANNCTGYIVSSSDGPESGYSRWELREAIMAFAQKEPTEGETCADTCRPDYEKMNAELMKELDYWKIEHRRMNEENIRLGAILRTVEVWTGKNFLG